MALHKFVSVMALGVLAAASSAALAQGKPNACFANHSAVQALPYYTDVTSAYSGVVQKLSGARVFIEAERGLTEQWLYRELTERIAARKAGTTCPLDIPGVSIAIQSGGPGFWVNIRAADDKQAKEVLRRARASI